MHRRTVRISAAHPLCRRHCFVQQYRTSAYSSIQKYIFHAHDAHMLTCRMPAPATRNPQSSASMCEAFGSFYVEGLHTCAAPGASALPPALCCMFCCFCFNFSLCASRLALKSFGSRDLSKGRPIMEGMTSGRWTARGRTRRRRRKKYHSTHTLASNPYTRFSFSSFLEEDEGRARLVYI
jgi:hypothetical protein